MEEHLVVNVSMWGAVLGMILSCGGIITGIAAILRLWLQPMVGRWIDLALERERKLYHEGVESLRLELHACQQGREQWRGGVERHVSTAENRLEKAVERLDQRLDGISRELTGVREDLARLTGAVSRANGGPK